MIKNYISTTLILLMFAGANIKSMSAQVPNDKTSETVKAEVRKQGIGEEAKVVVKLKNGTKQMGYISQVLDDSFDLTDPKTKQIDTVPYRDVAKVKRDGWPSGAKVALGIGIGVAVVVAVVAGAIAKKGLSGFCPLGCTSMLRPQ